MGQKGAPTTVLSNRMFSSIPGLVSFIGLVSGGEGWRDALAPFSPDSL